ncbi:hypothetical protein KIH74_11195 [Kineosporia sp. J2-2]|uniref:Uncharacterized protein n=1 Tax=Kineosporia corallincola TaxID=2835133 RepID=A0ABS5TEH8_9ACTN|nr:hypothetical protein [Kineosporia corallincola]MBT0769489.1 hypothetical protein [Kineosporia corallincola]
MNSAPSSSPQQFPAEPDPRRRPVVIVATAALAALVTAVALRVLPDQLSGPERTIERYFGALENRDLNAALGLTQIRTGDDASTGHPDLGTYAPLSENGYDPPTEVKVSAVTQMQPGDARIPPGFFPTDTAIAQVQLKYQVNGQELEDQTLLVRPGGSNPFRGWQVYSAQPQITLTAGGTLTPEVNDKAAQSVSGRWQLNALPGSYTVGVADDPVFGSEPASALVRLTEGDAVDLRAVLKPELQQAVAAQVKAYVDECATSSEPAPEGCPFSAGSGYLVMPDELSWEVKSYPTLAYAVSDVPGILEVSTSSEGSMEARDARADTFADQVSFSVGGTARISDGQVEFTPDVS